ncbi:MAG: dTDP-4-dehydrorhamnose reductase [Candidatus Aminicenantes bacterium]|nr:dTDP-4-dehydrorhamnose reductase [Candidatus Aminicenantes bacterium]
MKIALIGADGQLGTDLSTLLKGTNLSELLYPDFDITKPERAKKILYSIKPDVVINTAAYHRVDECEENPEKSFEVNALAVRELAYICLELDAALVHFSTDYVFDGIKKTPYIEEDCPNPLSIYGVSKLAGEYFVQNILEKHFIIRTCGLYGIAGCWGKGKNFVDTIVEQANKGRTIRVVNDQWITPTSTEELAQKVLELIQSRQYGLYHLTNEGECTWFGFAQKIFKIIGQKPDLEPVTTEQYGAKAKRPPYSVLENKRAKDIGLTDFSYWEEALRNYLLKKGYIQEKSIDI